MFRQLTKFANPISVVYTRWQVRALSSKPPTPIKDVYPNRDLELLRSEMLQIIDVKYKHINERINYELILRDSGQVSYTYDEDGLMKKILDNDTIRQEIMKIIDNREKK